jgi:hypothetical protein
MAGSDQGFIDQTFEAVQNGVLVQLCIACNLLGVFQTPSPGEYGQAA